MRMLPNRNRFTRFTRNFGRRRRARGNWVSQVAVNEALTLTGAAADSFVLVEDEDVDAQTTTLVQRSVTVSRVIIDANIRMVPDVTAESFAFSTWWYALIVLDNDENSGLLNTAARGSLLHSNRVLHAGISSRMVRRVDASATAAVEYLVYEDQRIQIDWKGGVRIGPEQYLAFSLHPGGSISTHFTSGALNMVARSRLVSMR